MAIEPRTEPGNRADLAAQFGHFGHVCTPIAARLWGTSEPARCDKPAPAQAVSSGSSFSGAHVPAAASAVRRGGPLAARALHLFAREARRTGRAAPVCRREIPAPDRNHAAGETRHARPTRRLR